MNRISFFEQGVHESAQSIYVFFVVLKVPHRRSSARDEGLETSHQEMPLFQPFRLPMFSFRTSEKRQNLPWLVLFTTQKKIPTLLHSAITLPPLRDYNLILNRVISLKAHFKHSLKVQGAWDISVSIFYLPRPLTAASGGFRLFSE